MMTDQMQSTQAPVTSAALNENWLQSGATQTGYTVSNADNAVLTTTGCYSPYFWGNYTYPARPIRLTMDEVKRLQKAAAADKALRDILAKFTAQIEVIVAFK